MTRKGDLQDKAASSDTRWIEVMATKNVTKQESKLGEKSHDGSKGETCTAAKTGLRSQDSTGRQVFLSTESLRDAPSESRMVVYLNRMRNRRVNVQGS